MTEEEAKEYIDGVFRSDKWMPSVIVQTKAELDAVIIPEGFQACGRAEDEESMYLWDGTKWVLFSAPITIQGLDEPERGLTRSEVEEIFKSQKIGITLNEVEVQKLNLQPNDVLVVKFQSDEINRSFLEHAREGIQEYFKNNKVLVTGIRSGDSMDLTVIKESDLPQQANFCSDCGCGKKEAYESSNG